MLCRDALLAVVAAGCITLLYRALHPLLRNQTRVATLRKLLGRQLREYGAWFLNRSALDQPVRRALAIHLTDIALLTAFVWDEEAAGSTSVFLVCDRLFNSGDRV